ncbi:MAG: hypothetical protein ACOCZ3_02660 [Bacillota bacterium]
MIAESLTTILLLSVIVEVVTNGVKSIFPYLKGDRSRIVAAIIGISICIITNTGILSQLNIAIRLLSIDYIITGIIISRGSSAVHDIISIFDRQNTRVI